MSFFGLIRLPLRRIDVVVWLIYWLQDLEPPVNLLHFIVRLITLAVPLRGLANVFPLREGEVAVVTAFLGII